MLWHWSIATIYSMQKAFSGTATPSKNVGWSSGLLRPRSVTASNSAARAPGTFCADTKTSPNRLV